MSVADSKQPVSNHAGNHRTKTRVQLKTWNAASEIFAKHLKPVSNTPKGWPVYAQEEINALVDSLNICLPEEF